MLLYDLDDLGYRRPVGFSILQVTGGTTRVLREGVLSPKPGAAAALREGAGILLEQLGIRRGSAITLPDTYRVGAAIFKFLSFDWLSER